MKVDQETLARAISRVASSSRLPQVADAQSVMIIKRKGALILRTTDLAVFSEAIIKVEDEDGDEDIVTAVLLDPLSAFVDSQGSSLKFILSEKTALLSSGKQKGRLKTLDHTGFASWPEVPSEVSIDGEAVISAMKAVCPFASSVLVTPELFNVHVVLGRRGRVEAADGRRYGKIDVTSKANADILVPMKSVDSLTAYEGKTKVGVSGNYLFFTTKEEGMLCSVWARCSNGNYPDVLTKIPLRFKTQLAVKKETLAKAIRVGLSYSDINERDVKLDVTRKNVVVSAGIDTIGNYASALIAKTKGVEMSIVLDGKHLQDACTVLGERLVVKTNGAKEVCVIQDEHRTLMYAMWPLIREEKK